MHLPSIAIANTHCYLSTCVSYRDRETTNYGSLHGAVEPAFVLDFQPFSNGHQMRNDECFVLRLKNTRHYASTFYRDSKHRLLLVYMCFVSR